MGEPRVVYVVAHDGGCEGYSKPLRAFATEQLAIIFKDGADAAYTAGMTIFPLEVIDVLPTNPKETGLE